ncbi:MAG: redoxin domain-containing protein [Phycisphaerales bacterium]
MCIITLLLISILVGTGPSAPSERVQSGEPVKPVVETSPPREGTSLPTFPQERLAEMKLADTTGTAHALFGQEGPDLVVVVLLSTTCPIANASIPEIRRVHDAVKKVGGRFYAVHPMIGTTAESASLHARERQLKMPVLLDPRQHLVREFKGTVVPEVFILTRSDAAWTLRYRGPLDNLYAEIGRRRRNATKAYARDVISQIVSGRPVPVSKRPAVGCLIEQPAKGSS